MISKEQKLKAKEFQALHHDNKMLLIPNAWNAGSAKVFENQGYKAVASTSAGIAYSLGYADGEIIELDDLLLVTKQINKRVNLPLSIDMERGYAEDAYKVKQNIGNILKAGAVGINMEDGRPDGKLDDIELQLEKIQAISELKEELDLPFVINARTCAFWLKVGNPKENMEIAIKRSNAFLKAGADCVFVPGLLEKNSIINLLSNIDGPLNIIANPLYHDLEGLQKLGVSRLSLGSGPVRASYAKLIQSSKEIIENGNISSLIEHDFSYAEANRYFAK